MSYRDHAEVVLTPVAGAQPQVRDDHGDRDHALILHTVD